MPYSSTHATMRSTPRSGVRTPLRPALWSAHVEPNDATDDQNNNNNRTIFITALWSAHVEPNDATDDQNNAPHLCETQSLSEE